MVVDDPVGYVLLDAELTTREELFARIEQELRRCRQALTQLEEVQQHNEAVLLELKPTPEEEAAAQERERRKRGRPPGWGLGVDELLATIDAMHRAGTKVTRESLHIELACSISAVKRACTRAGLKGRL